MEKEKYRPFFSTPFVASLTIGFIFFALLALVINIPKRQIIEKKAAVAQSVRFYFVPSDTKIDSNEVKVSLYAQFTNGSSSEHVDYLRTAVMLPTDGRLMMKSGTYTTTSFSTNPINFDRIFHVDGPTVTNTDKKMIVELGSSLVNQGPVTSNTQNGGAGLKVAEFTLVRNPAVTWTANSSIGFKVDSILSQVVVAPNSEKIPVTSDSFVENGPITYVQGYTGGTPTPTTGGQPTSTPVPTNTPTRTPTPSAAPTTTPTPTRTPTPIPSNTPVPTATPLPTNTPTPLPTNTPIPTSTPTPTRTPTPVPSNTPAPSGAPTVTSVPSVTGIACTRKTQGDANCDGVIDGVDYSIWLNTQCHVVAGSPAFCSPQPSVNYDANFNQDALNNRDDDDYYIWFSNRWT